MKSLSSILYPLSSQEEIVRLGEDLPLVWDHPAASPELKKRILRVLFSEIVVKVIGDQISMVLHWQGGDDTELQFPKNKTGQHRWKTDAGVEQLIEQLARVMPDEGIASLLNRLGKRTAHGHTWTKARVRVFRNDRRVALYQQGKRQARGELTLEEAASQLEVSKMTVHRLIQKKLLPARQACAGAVGDPHRRLGTAWRQTGYHCRAANSESQSNSDRFSIT